MYELRGDSHAEAYRKVFAGPLSLPRRQREAGLAPGERRVTSAAWVHYSERFYERRWFVPAVAAALSPLAGTDALRVTSLLFFVALGPVLYALLRRRTSSVASFVLAAGATVLPPVLFVAGLPLLDVCGATLEAAAALGAVLVLERGASWLLLWGGALAALSLTRDSTVVLGLAVVWVALRERTRRGLALVVVGAAASLPVPLALGAPVREALAYTLNDFRPPPHAGWGFVGAHYWPALRSLVRSDLTYLGDHPYAALYLVLGYCALFVLRAHGDRFVRFFRAAAVGSIALDALQPNYTAFRLELTFVPIAAAGLAVMAARVNLHTIMIRFGEWRD